MNTEQRIEIYGRSGHPTARQRRRIIKKAGRDPQATVVRDDGMGYPPSMNGYRELIGLDRPPVAPVSGAPVGTGRGHEAVEAWIDEQAF